MGKYYDKRRYAGITFCLFVFLTALFYCPKIAMTEENYLGQGITYYEYGDYDNSIKSLKQINEFTEAKKNKTLMHLYLALDYYAKGMSDSMNIELKALYRSDPDFTPNPVIVPPSVISAYNEVKQHTTITIPATVKENERNYWLRAVPFGAGQFAKGENKKGTVLLIAEAAALAANVSTYYIRQSKKNPDGSYNNVSWAKNMQDVQLTAFWLFVGTASYGIIDAFAGRLP